MNNHTTYALLLIAAICTSTTVYAMSTNEHSSTTEVQHTQPLGTGHIQGSNTATNHTTELNTGAVPESEVGPRTRSVTHKSNATPVNTTTANLLLVRDIAKEFGHHETMQAILMQESNGGNANPVGNLNSPSGKRSYGIMQVQPVAGRFVLSRTPSLAAKYFPGRKVSSITDKEIITLLLTNDEANVRIAVHHFNIYLSIVKGNWSKAVAAYNMGIGNALKRASVEDVAYVKSIRSRIVKHIKPFNKAHPGTLT